MVKRTLIQLEPIYVELCKDDEKLDHIVKFLNTTFAASTRSKNVPKLPWSTVEKIQERSQKLERQANAVYELFLYFEKDILGKEACKRVAILYAQCMSVTSRAFALRGLSE